MLGALLAGLTLPAWGQFAPTKVTGIEIKHVGPRTVSDHLIRANIRTKVGDAYNPALADDDVRTLYRTGLFYNIRVTEERGDDGVVLNYVVQAKPRLTELTFEGNRKFSDAKLKKKISSKVGEPLDEQKLFNDTRTIQESYQKTGFPRTEVKYTVNIDEAAGRGTATFTITENPRTRIREVQFEGANAFPASKLRKQIKTRKRWAFSWLTGSGVFKDDQLQEDRERLAEFYRQNGFMDFEIRDVQLEFPTPDRMIVRFVIFEGQQYRVGNVTFQGTTMFPTNSVDRFRLRPGAVFSPKELSRDIAAVEDFYGARGHIDVTPPSGLRVRRVPNTETGTIDLEFLVEEGQKSFVERIEIRGNTKTKDRVIRRELAISPGETFDMVRVKMSKRRLEGLQFFEKVDSRVEPTEIPNRKDLIIVVEEKNTGNLSLGAGFSSVDSLVGFVELSQGNFDLFNPPVFTGDGQKFRLRVQLGTERQDVVVSFIEPWFLDRKLALGTDFYYRQLGFESVNDLYDRDVLGGRISLTRALGSDFLIGSVNYSLESVDVYLNSGASLPTIVREDLPGRGEVISVLPGNVPPSIREELGKSLISKIGGSLAYDTRNSTMLPDAGQRTEVSAEIASQYLGGERDYYKLELRTAWYLRGFRKGHVLEVIARTGVTEGFDGDSTPFWDKYYLGGLYSLRGFEFRSVSPRDPGYSEPVGGGTYWYGSLEYSIPIIQKEKVGGVRFAVFYDIGNVMADAYDYDFKNYLDNWGVGLRLNLPIGPLRLDYAIPINTDQYNDDGGQFQFGVGYTREF